MTRDLRSQLTTLSQHEALRPNEAWVRALKERVDDIPATSSVPHGNASFATRAYDLMSFVIPRQMFVGARMTAVYALIIGLAGYGWTVSVSAAQTSLPGDILYNVKKANEKTELFFAGSKSDEKVAVLLDHASRRAEELKQIQALPENNLKKTERAKTVVDSLKKNIASTNEEIAKAKIDKTVDTVALVSVVSEKITQLSTNLGTALTTGTTTPETDDLSTDVKNEVVAVAALAEETKVHAVVTAVERNTDGSVTEESESHVVAKTVGQTLSSLQTTLSTYEAAASSTPTGTLPVAVVVPLPPSETGTSTTATSSTVSTLDIVVSPAVSTASSTTSSTVPVPPSVSLEDQVHAVSAVLADAKALLAQENIRGAVEKMQAAVNALKSIQPQFSPDVTARAYSVVSGNENGSTQITIPVGSSQAPPPVPSESSSTGTTKTVTSAPVAPSSE